MTNEILDRIRGGYLKLPEENLAIYRVKHADSTDDARLSRIMSLVLDGTIALENVALNHIVYFLSMMGQKHVYPLFHYCRRDKTYLFGVDGETLYSCTELMAPSFAVGSYYPKVSFTPHFAEDRLVVEDTCKSCPVFPMCGGSCDVYRNNTAGATNCNYYAEIVEMVDMYIKRMFSNQQEAQQ